jgi:hypothetical protein
MSQSRCTIIRGTCTAYFVGLPSLFYRLCFGDILICLFVLAPDTPRFFIWIFKRHAYVVGIKHGDFKKVR